MPIETPQRALDDLVKPLEGLKGKGLIRPLKGLIRPISYLGAL